MIWTKPRGIYGPAVNLPRVYHPSTFWRQQPTREGVDGFFKAALLAAEAEQRMRQQQQQALQSPGCLRLILLILIEIPMHTLPIFWGLQKIIHLALK